MTKIYYACDWAIKPIAGYSSLLYKADELGCNMVKLGGISEDKDGFHRLTIAAAAESEHIIRAIIEYAEELMGMDEWYEISETQYSKGIEFSKFLSPPDSMPPLERLATLGRLNCAIEDRVTYKNQSNLYYSCACLLNKRQLEYLKFAYDNLDTLGASMYKLYIDTKDVKKPIAIFAIRIPSEKILKRFIAETQKYIQFTNWEPISEEFFYANSVKFCGFWTIEEFVKHWQESIDNSH